MPCIRLVPGVDQRRTECTFRLFPGRHSCCPIYTRPADYKGWKVPEILLSGQLSQDSPVGIRPGHGKNQATAPDLLKEEEIIAELLSYPEW